MSLPVSSARQPPFRQTRRQKKAGARGDRSPSNAGLASAYWPYFSYSRRITRSATLYSRMPAVPHQLREFLRLTVSAAVLVRPGNVIFTDRPLRRQEISFFSSEDFERPRPSAASDHDPSKPLPKASTDFAPYLSAKQLPDLTFKRQTELLKGL